MEGNDLGCSAGEKGWADEGLVRGSQAFVLR